MSRPPRFFITSEQIRENRITVAGDDLRHIRNVLRMGPGDLLALSDGRGTEYTVRITEAGRTSLTAEIVGETKRTARGPRITLGQGLPKSDKMDWIVQKATELGVSSIVPLITERTIVKVRDEEKRAGRWQKIAREAAMQSNRPDIPEVGAIRRLGDFLRTLHAEPGTVLLFPWEEGATPLKAVLRERGRAEHVFVLIGPEGGFSQGEAGAAREKGFEVVSLGPNILRTETAAIAVVSMIIYETL